MAILAAALMAGACDREVVSTQNEAKPHAAEAHAVSGENIEKALSAAQAYLDSQDVPKAQAILLTLIDRAPRDARAREMLGRAYAVAAIKAQEQRDANKSAEFRIKAYEQYKIATDLDPASPGLQHSAGQIALLAGNVDAALEHYRAASRLDEKNPQYPLFEAQILIQRQEFDEAKSALNRALALDPDEAIAHASLAMIALEQQQFDEAIARITEARRIDTADLGLRAQEAKVHRRAGSPRKALELLVGLSAAERAQEMVAFEIAAAYDQMQQPMNAARAWEHVYQSNPMAPNAWLAAVRTGEFLLKAEEREQAAMWLGQAKLAAPNASQVKALEEAIGKAQ